MRDDGLQPGDDLFGIRAAQHLLFLLRRHIPQRQLHKEAVKLRLGQRERSVRFDGVLRRHHDIGLRQREGLAVDRDLAFLHDLQKRGLTAVDGTVDLIRKNHVREQRPAAEFKRALFLIIIMDPRQIGGQNVRRELDALELAADAAGEGSEQHRFSRPRQILQQNVTGGDQADADPPDRVLLADDDLAAAFLQPVSK